jgi:hypothetical protein
MAAGVSTYTAMALARKLESRVPDHRVEAAQLAVKGHTYAGLSIAEASVRIWWPITVVGCLTGFRRSLALLAGAAWLRRLRSARGGPAERIRSWAIGVVDDLAFGAGVWVGAIRRRSARCLAPRLVRWPGDDRQ